MKYRILLFLGFIFFNFYNISHAHSLKTDGSIGVEMHVDPEDNPIAGQESILFFEVADKDNKFTEDQCDCVVTISQNGKEVYSQKLTKLELSYIFKETGLYEVKISGKPNADQFQPFSLIYNVSVMGKTDFNKKIFHASLVIISTGLVIIFILKSLKKS